MVVPECLRLHRRGRSGTGPGARRLRRLWPDLHPAAGDRAHRQVRHRAGRDPARRRAAGAGAAPRGDRADVGLSRLSRVVHRDLRRGAGAGGAVRRRRRHAAVSDRGPRHPLLWPVRQPAQHSQRAACLHARERGVHLLWALAHRGHPAPGLDRPDRRGRAGRQHRGLDRLRRDRGRGGGHGLLSPDAGRAGARFSVWPCRWPC